MARMNSFVNYVIIILLVAANIYWITIVKEKDSQLFAIGKSKDIVLNQFQHLKKRQIASFELNNTKFIGQLSEVNKGGELYVFFNEVHCSECFTHIMKVFDENGVSDLFTVTALTYFVSNRDFITFKEKYRSFNCKFINCYDSKIPSKFLQLEVPIVFTLKHNESTISNVFIPEKTLPEMSNKYCKGLLKIGGDLINS